MLVSSPSQHVQNKQPRVTRSAGDVQAAVRTGSPAHVLRCLQVTTTFLHKLCLLQNFFRLKGWFPSAGLWYPCSTGSRAGAFLDPTRWARVSRLGHHPHCPSWDRMVWCQDRAWEPATATQAFPLNTHTKLQRRFRGESCHGKSKAALEETAPKRPQHTTAALLDHDGSFVLFVLSSAKN